MSSPTKTYLFSPLRFVITSILALVAMASACSRPQQDYEPSSVGAPTTTTSSTTLQSVSLEQLETDAAFMADAPPEERAIALSRRWLEHGKTLRRSSYTGSFAAFARALHVSSEMLITMQCGLSRKPLCHELHTIYTHSLELMINVLIQNSWNPPDLQRTRYRLSKNSVKAIQSLAGWQFPHESPSVTNATKRSGMGFATVGCRSLGRSTTVCSPLTFIALFSTPSDSQESQLELTAHDAYQQEVVTIGNTYFPLAAAFTETAHQLASIASQREDSGLYCISLPTPTTLTSLIIVNSSDISPTVDNLIVPLLRDSSVCASTTICIQTVEAGIGGVFSPYSVMSSLVSAHSQSTVADIVNNGHQPIVLIPIGPKQRHYALTLASTMRRNRLPRQRINSSRRLFDPRRIIAFASNLDVNNNTQPEQENFILDYPYPCDSQCLSTLRTTLLQTISTHRDSSAPSPGPQLGHDDLDISPVI